MKDPKYFFLFHFEKSYPVLNWLNCTLKSWVHQIAMLFRTFSPGLEDFDTFQCSSNSFPHWPHISIVCKTVRTTLKCIVVFQLQGVGPENLSWIRPIVMCLFMTFFPWLENNNTSKCSSDSFAHTLRYVVNVENCQNYIDMYQCPPFAGRRS